ncbi:hypothetical protein R1sor_010492 [Riccia sorocarpa]|uniref:Uncharacterized protein n=1 Tax=Riccia sorocarpa TaxID=122646 RepID=A0ABD3I298_9MARC
MRSITDSPTMRHVENAYHGMAYNPRAKPSNFDVYMGPMVDELKLLWNGVPTYDARLTCPEEQRRFTLNGICLWTMHDSPGLGIVYGLQVSGTRGCPTCGMNLESKYSKHLKTTIYMGHKRYLSQTSHMRGDCTTPKPHVTHFTDWYVLEYEIQQGVQRRAQSGLYRIPLLVELPYYDSFLIQNLGDPMHEEGNITKNLFRHMFGHVDKMHHRGACEEFNVHQEAWPYRRYDGTEGKR